MNVELARGKKVQFRTLSGGECFTGAQSFNEDIVFMKVDEGQNDRGGDINAVDLRDGELVYVDLHSDVTPCDVKVTCTVRG